MLRTNQNLMPALLDELMDWNRWNNVMTCESPREMPKMNITESDADYRIEMCIPGMKKEDLSLVVDAENHLVVEMQQSNEEKKEEGRKVIRRDFTTTRFKQMLSLPENVKNEQIVAKVENGILYITLPKVTEKERKEKLQHIAIA
ncbi:MAG: Hsp20/alpha crystallin family protein [Bacteroidales bacterium]|nr:Hsp20/alpha crystallin family protein [Bacteroidales bacterium]